MRFLPDRESSAQPVPVARLNPARIERLIREMEIGEIGWSVPWAMEILEDGSAFLRPTYSVHPEPGGTVAMRIGRDNAGYVVDITRCGYYQWHRVPYANDGIPVIGIKQ